MPKHMRSSALTVLALTAATLGTTLGVQAHAEAAPTGAKKTAVVKTVAAKTAAYPRFLAASELPPHPTSAWTADKVKDGVPESLTSCLHNTLLAYDVRYREFRTDLETSARQVTVVVGNDTKAAALAKGLNRDFRACALNAGEGDPDIDTRYRDYGTLPVEEGAHVHGVQTSTSWGSMDIGLVSVGRDGRTVTVVDWGQMGDFDDAPVKAFKKTTTTAVNKLH
ncbi:hypothetical protein SLINC_6673 [Streptomyces lincolnensis]|uniref:Uncharacterized protein n=1 Tax=Streptomyces lincolnensis TaxID=1915 RepID=A0A1B1MK52_STRLN|nr:hypothetical protein [Streptomyces lincolnensis]ANS68897.1 hypothetical protein SLINC_6673 [Streptomyces lincolnensis]AXG52897.1 hypothetical protein SLCG_1742 [Streptomyces lincolnensis]QMV10496.1 hypothetical protein GJU35_35750 [Streptomyces lincolnensis]